MIWIPIHCVLLASELCIKTEKVNPHPIEDTYIFSLDGFPRITHS